LGAPNPAPEEVAVTAADRDTQDSPEVPVLERVVGGSLTQRLRSDAMQQLMAGRVDYIEVKCVKSYIGQASMDGPFRRIRMSIRPELEDDELAFILCHELAHHEVGVERKHCDAWRETCAALVREAGELGLMSAERVQQAAEMALDGTASIFRGWPEEARKLKQKRDEHREELLEIWRERGLQVGGQIVFRYRGKLLRAEVMRINTATVSVGEIGSRRTALRVPLSRILGIHEQ
jgi:hypothetical protein